jgi:acyl-CoA thioester hydrolase
MDSLGHVNNVAYVDYLQEARVDMLAVHPPQPGAEALVEGVVVARHEVEFTRPLVYRPAPVRIETWVRRVRAADFSLGYEVRDDDASGDGVSHPGGNSRRPYVRATSVLVPYDFAAQRPRRLTAAERSVLAQFLEPDD